MNSLRQGASLVRRAAAPAACFGSGYLFCWTQSREETVPQLLACSGLISWCGLAKSIRQMRNALPETAEWPREKLAKAESLELRVLAQAASSCQGQDLACPLMWRIVLQNFCDYTQEQGLQSLGVQGLAPFLEAVEGDAESVGSYQGTGLTEYVSVVDEAAIALTDASHGKTLLGPVSGSLRRMVHDDGSISQPDIDSASVLRVTRTALIASSWHAESLRASSSSSCSPDESVNELTVEELEEASSQLTQVWQALARPSAAPSARAKAKAAKKHSELSDLLHDVNLRMSHLQTAPPVPAQKPPLQADLPARLVARMCEANSAPRAMPKASWPSKQPAAAPAKVQAKSEPKGVVSTSWKFLEYAAWAGLIGGVAVAVSADGLGFFDFHVLPEDVRPGWQAFLQQKAARVEELCQLDMQHVSQDGGDSYPASPTH